MLHRTLGLVALIAVSGVASAGSVVILFADGRTLEAAHVERRGSSARISLQGGGSMELPASRIVNWKQIQRVPDGVVEGERLAAFPVAAAVAPVEPWREAAGELAELFAVEAERNGLSPALLIAMAQVESGLDPYAVSPKGATGLLQLMPATAQRFGVQDSFDPGDNVAGGARYLRWLLERFEGRTDLALAGYNAGERNVERFDGIPPFAETRDYVARVLESAERLTGSGSMGP